MDFDECLTSVGGFGTYQKVIIYLVLLPAVLPCAFHAYNQVFMSAKPEHWCRVKELEERNFSSEVIRNVSIPVGSGCSMYDGNFTKNGWIVDNATETTCTHGWVYDMSRYEATIVTEWDLVCERGHHPTLALVVFGAGGLIGNLLFGYLQDSLGRRPAFFIYMLIETVFSVGSVFAESFFFWMVLRFGVGFTIPAILGTPYVLSVELVGPEKRAFCTVLINIVYSLALVALSGVVYIYRDWRRLTLVSTLPFTVFFFYWWVLPESPRWLAANGMFEKAGKILKMMAEVNGKTWSPDIMEILKYSYEENERKNQKTARYGVRDLFRYPKLRVNTIIITFIWFTNTAVYVGLSYYTPSLVGDEFFNFFLSGAVELPTYIFLLHAIEKGGRQWTLCVSMMIGGLACLGTFAFQDAHTLLITLYCIGKMGISCSFVVLPLLASELYPTVVRGIGISFSSVIGQIGPIVIPIINYLGRDWMVLPLLIMGVISVAGGLLSLLLPETLNLHLPQNLADGQSTPLAGSISFSSESWRGTGIAVSNPSSMSFDDLIVEEPELLPAEEVLPKISTTNIGQTTISFNDLKLLSKLFLTNLQEMGMTVRGKTGPGPGIMSSGQTQPKEDIPEKESALVRS